MKNIVIKLFVVLMLLGNMAFSQDWEYVNSTGTEFILYGMSFPPDQSTIGYACGMEYTHDADGVIVKTIDGGDNWEQIWPQTGVIDGLQGIWFINDTDGFAGGWNNYFIKTTDGGDTWTPVTVGTGIWYFTDVVFWDDDNGIAAARMDPPGEAVFVTDNGGDTWTQASGINENVMGVAYGDQNTLYAVGTGGKVMKSTDGGHSWSMKSQLGSLLFGVGFADANFGVVGAEEKMFATEDGGTTWSTYTTGYENFYATKAFTNGKAYIGGTDENIYVTLDYGDTWQFEHNGPGTSSLYRIRVTENGTAFACGSQGTILKKLPPVSADFSADVTEVCEGGVVQFTDESAGEPTSWEWTFQGGIPGTSTEQNPSVTYPAAGEYDVELTVSDGIDSDTEIKENYITVITIPAQADIPSGPTETCEGGTYNYTTSYMANADIYEWIVEPGDAGIISGTGTVGTFEAATGWTGTYNVKVRAENECGIGPWSETLEANMYYQPMAFNFTGGGTICEGDPGLEFSIDGSETDVDYELYRSLVSTGIIVPGTGDPISFGLQTEEGFYTARGYTDQCLQSMTGGSNLYVDPLPGQPSTPSGPEAVCRGDVAVYATTGASDADSYTWTLTPPEAGTMTPDAMEVEITWSETFSGQAYLSVYGTNECGNGPVSEELEVSYAGPEPDISGPQLVCVNDVEEYMTADNPGNSYTWEVTGGSVVGGAGTSLIAVQWETVGTGTLKVTEENEMCSVISEIYEVVVDECTSIDEIGATSFRIYPNPADDVIHVELLTVEDSEDNKWEIFNAQGKLMDQGQLSEKDESFHINTSEYPVGIYLFQMESGSGVLTKRFIIR